jgi:hypothetical protein
VHITYFQNRIVRWGDGCFGPEINRDVRIRRNVALEEMTELHQSAGGTLEEALDIVRRTYGRPVGELETEFGGVMVTTTLLAHAMGRNMDDMSWTEMIRCEERTDEIREKRKSKPHAQLEKDL